MNYKRIIKSRSLRLKILRFFSFVPDETMLRFQYLIKTGRPLNLKNPQRFTEKLQWYKLHYKNPLMIPCVDKADVREYVESKGLGDILIPCYGVYDSADDIDWGSLPDQFVMKDTLGGGGTSVVIVKDKSSEDIEELKRKADLWTAKDSRAKGSGREWPYYSGKKHRIIIEKYIASPDGAGGLQDYKFFCFGGKTAFLYVMGDRQVGESVKVSLFDRDFNKLPVHRVGDLDYAEAQMPQNYRALLETAEKLSSGFPHVRVDLYDVGGKIYFGEMTFYNASGYMQFDPDEFDIEIGKVFELTTFVGCK